MFLRNSFRSVARAFKPNTVRYPLIAGTTAVGVSYFALNALAASKKEDDHHAHAHAHEAPKVESKLAEEAKKLNFASEEPKDAAPAAAEEEEPVDVIVEEIVVVEESEPEAPAEAEASPIDEAIAEPVAIEGVEVAEVVEPKSEEAPAADAAEEDADHSQSAAYNPETGEINWDCPCLGGMANGPCGEEFKEAFACFVYSETEPKGIDCIKKFEGMRNCFRQYPEHYREELYEDEEPVPAVDSEGDAPAAAAAAKEDAAPAKEAEPAAEPAAEAAPSA